MTFKITAPVKPETQTARIQLNLTPSLKTRITAAAKAHDTSTNSLICQLVDAGLVSLAEMEAGE